MTIDELCLICPFSLKKKRGKVVRQFSDHNTILLKLKIPMLDSTLKKKSVERKWKITDEGLLKFKKITSDVSKAKQVMKRTLFLKLYKDSRSLGVS